MVNIPHSSKMSYREGDPIVPSVSLGDAVRTIAIGLARWGPIAGEFINGVKQKYSDVRGFPEFRRVFGGFDASHDAAKYAWAYFAAQGQVLYFARTVHFADPSDPATSTAARSTATIKYTSAAPTYGTVICTQDAPYELDNGDDLDFKVDGGSTDSAAFDATAAEEADTTSYPVTAGTGFMVLKIDRGSDQTITFLGTETTNLEIAATINAQLKGGWAEVATGQVKIWSDTEGLSSYVEITTNPVANPLLTFPTSEIQGTSAAGISDISAVTIAEIKAWVESEVTNTLVTDLGSNRFSVSTTTSGAAGSIQVEASSTADTKMGLDNSIHSGTDTTDLDALTVDGKYAGTRGDDFDIVIAAATSGDALLFDLEVQESGVFAERYYNVDDTTVADLINAESDLIQVTVDSANNPDVGTYPLTGGDDGIASIDNNDYAGDADAGTGIRCFDSLKTFRVALTDREDFAHVKAFQTYLKTARKAIGVLLYDIPEGSTQTQARTYMDTNGLKGFSEFGATYWPYTNAPNPNKAIFGANVKEVPFPSSAWEAGRTAYTSAQSDAGFSDEAANVKFGHYEQATSVTDDDANKEDVRDRLYPEMINPIRYDSGKVFCDGVLVNKVDGNFPSVAQRITACETAHRILEYLDKRRHRGMDDDFMKEIHSGVDTILERLMLAGAYATKAKVSAYYIDMSENTPVMRRNMRLKLKIGIATKSPFEFGDLELGYNERGLIYQEVVKT